MGRVLDVAIRHGTVVTAEQTWRADVGIQDGTIVELGSVGSASQEIDATGLLILPGGVDEHTHFEYQARPDGPWSADDWLSGTISAACGGVTTVVDYARQDRGRPRRHHHADRLRDPELRRRPVSRVRGLDEAR
jgi:dihydropyrimidinase